MLTVTDLFCGAGGSSQGAHAVPGVEVVLAANHWQLAVDTHAANFPEVAHDTANISQADPRRYRRTSILWASPECTNHSQAKGRKRGTDSQPDLFGELLPDEAAVRSRSTMWDVPRFAEHHRYDAVIVENVVDAARWIMWPAWLHAMRLLGYEHRTVWLNSMHAPGQAAPRAPQSRDRLYVVFWRAGNPAPVLDVCPPAWCAGCGRDVAAMQWWKKPTERWGRYRAQYLYRCPACRAVVEPYALPAAAAIDWALPGQRIGDRERPLRPATLARIEAGLRRYARPVTMEVGGNTFERPGYVRAWPTDRPTPTLTTTATRALLVPAGGTWNGHATPTSDPMRTRTTRETEALVVPDSETYCTECATYDPRGELPGPWHNPFCSMHQGGDAMVVPVEGRDGIRAHTASEPLRTQTARLTDALVVPYYGTGVARLADQPLPTVTTVEGAALAFVATLRGGGDRLKTRHVDEPLSTVTANGQHHMLVRQNTARGDAGQMCTPVSEPARTITTAGHQSLVGWTDPPAVEDCTFRMLQPGEIQAAMAFARSYRVLGNRREQVRQLGNAVTPPAAEWLIRAVAESLGGAA